MRYVLTLFAILLSQVASAGMPMLVVILDGGETKNYTFNQTSKIGEPMKLPTGTKTPCEFELDREDKSGEVAIKVYSLGCCTGKTCITTMLSCTALDTSVSHRTLHLQTEGKCVVLSATCD